MDIKAVLFDLDNTLNHIQEKVFLKTYLDEAGKFFADLMSPEEFVQRQMTVAAGYVTNNGDQSISECFKREFSKGLPCSGDEIWNRMIRFIHTAFPKFESLFQPHEGAVETVDELRKKGIRLVIASNPMWPGEIQIMRLKWAGLDPDHFDYITDAENSGYVKPRIEYYLEICRAIGLEPSQCLMVGDDPVNDGIAKTAGMIFYLVENEKSDNEKEISHMLRTTVDEDIPPPDQSGPLCELIHFINTLQAA